MGFTTTSGIAQSMKLHFILIDINKSISRSLINWQRTISQCYQTLFVCHYDRWEMKFHCHCNLHFSSYEHGWIAFRVLKVLHFYFLQTILCSLFCRAWNFFFYWFVNSFLQIKVINSLSFYITPSHLIFVFSSMSFFLVT